MLKTTDTDSVASGTMFQYSNSIVVVVAGTVFYSLSARIFDQSSVGAIALVIAINSVVSTVFSFGMRNALQHFTSYYTGTDEIAKLKGLFTYFMKLGVIISAVTGLVLAFVAPLLSAYLFHDVVYTYSLRIASFYFALSLFAVFLNGIAYGLKLFRVSFYFTLFGAPVSYSLGLLTGYLYHSFTLVIISLTTGSFLYALLLFSYLFRRSLLLRVEPVYEVRKVFTYSLLAFAYTITGFSASYIDRFVVAALTTLSQLGIYNFILLVFSAINFLTIPFANVLFSHFSSKFAEKNIAAIKSGVRLSITTLSSFLIPISLLIASLSREVMAILGGSAYTSGAPILVLVVVPYALVCFVPIVAKGLESIRSLRIFLLTSTVALGSNFVISVLLIPIYHLMGAALGLSSTFLISAPLILHKANKNKIFSMDHVAVLKIWIASLVMAVLTYQLSFLTGGMVYLVPVYVAAGFFMYIILLKLLRPFNDSDRIFLISLVSPRISLLRHFISFTLK